MSWTCYFLTQLSVAHTWTLQALTARGPAVSTRFSDIYGVVKIVFTRWNVTGLEMYILMLVVTAMFTMTAARNFSTPVPETSSSEHSLHESCCTKSTNGQRSASEESWLGQQQTFHFSTHQIQDRQLLDNSSSDKTDILLSSLEISDPILKYSHKIPFNTNILLSESLPTDQESKTVNEGGSNYTVYSINSEELFYNISPKNFQGDISNSSNGSASLFPSSGSVTVVNSSICFCNQCILQSDTVTENESENIYPECWYVKQFLASGHLNTGKLALKLLQQCIITESKSMQRSQNMLNQKNSQVVLLPEMNTTKVRELKQASYVLRSLELVYEWRKNYDAVKNNIIGDNDRHFDTSRYRRLLSSVDATLESLPMFLEAAGNLDGVGAACLDIIWAPVFTAALGKNRSAFELFLREEQSKLKKTLWTGSMFHDYLDPTVYSLLTLFGLLTNASLLFMFLRYKEMQVQRNVILLNLVVVDLMNLATVAPLYLLSKYCSPNLYTGELGCRVFLCYRIIVRYNIEFSLVALTAQRYSAVTSHRLSNRTRAVFYVLGVWMMSAVAALPHMIAFVLRDFSCFSFRKEPADIDFLIDHALMILLSLSVPAVVFMLSILMAQRLRRSIQEMPGELRQSFQKQGFARSRSARVVVALAVVFAFTHSPRALWYGWVPWSKIDRQSAAFLWIDGTMNYLYYLNSGLNPCAMYFSCSVFRKTFRKCFFCFSKENKTKDSSQSPRTQQCYTHQSCHL